MTLQSWIDWCQKQLSDLSLRLIRQGYTPARIEYLNQTSNVFADRYGYYLDRLNEIMDAIERNPDGYHHFDDFTKAKAALLNFTCEHRGSFLELGLAQTA